MCVSFTVPGEAQEEEGEGDLLEIIEI